MLRPSDLRAASKRTPQGDWTVAVSPDLFPLRGSAKAVAELLYMTPNERRNEAETLKRDQIKNFYTLLTQRNELLRPINDQGEICYLTNKEWAVRPLEILCGLLDQMLVSHARCVESLPMLEKNGDPISAGE